MSFLLSSELSSRSSRESSTSLHGEEPGEERLARTRPEMIRSNIRNSRSKYSVVLRRALWGSKNRSAGKKSEMFGPPPASIIPQTISLNSCPDVSSYCAMSMEKIVRDSMFSTVVKAVCAMSTACPSDDLPRT